MNYCEQCNYATEDDLCPMCGNKKLRAVNNNDFCYVTEDEEIRAKMFMEILKDNNIPVNSLSTVGAGMVMRAGVKEYLKIYVPYENIKEALELHKEAFGK